MINSWKIWNPLQVFYMSGACILHVYMFCYLERSENLGTMLPICMNAHVGVVDLSTVVKCPI